MAIKTLFLGSNWEALETLKTLYADKRFEIIGVITQPDKPVGRKQILMPTEIKQFCLDNNIEVFHTEGKSESYEIALKKFNPELILCKSFGEIVPGFFLEAPKYKAINVHYSLLPKYRGAVPIQKAILDGEKVTGITIVQMVAELDAGPILAKYKENIRDDDTNLSLRQRLVKKNCEVIGDILFKWCKGEITAIPQKVEDATFCWQKDISKENAQIDFINFTAQEIDRKVRALIPWPVAWTEFEGKKVKIFKALQQTKQFNSSIEVGVFYTFEKSLIVNCKEGCLIIKDLQIEGKNVVSSEEFVRGYIK
jgi:methionyl-tRNA formyltransferase